MMDAKKDEARRTGEKDRYNKTSQIFPWDRWVVDCGEFWISEYWSTILYITNMLAARDTFVLTRYNIPQTTVYKRGEKDQQQVLTTW